MSKINVRRKSIDIEEEYKKYETLFINTRDEVEKLVNNFSRGDSLDLKLAEKILVRFFKIENSSEYNEEDGDFFLFFRILKNSYDELAQRRNEDKEKIFNSIVISPLPLNTKIQENSGNITLNLINQELEKEKGQTAREYQDIEKNKLYQRIIKNRQNRIKRASADLNSNSSVAKPKSSSIVASKSSSVKNLFIENKNAKGSRNISSNMTFKSENTRNIKSISTVKFSDCENNLVSKHNIKDLIMYSTSLNKKSVCNPITPQSSSSPHKQKNNLLKHSNTSHNFLIETQIVNNMRNSQQARKFIKKNK